MKKLWLIPCLCMLFWPGSMRAGGLDTLYGTVEFISIALDKIPSEAVESTHRNPADTVENECPNNVAPCQTRVGLENSLHPNVIVRVNTDQMIHVAANISSGLGCQAESERIEADVPLVAGLNSITLLFDPPLDIGTQLSIIWQFGECPPTSCLDYQMSEANGVCADVPKAGAIDDKSFAGTDPQAPRPTIPDNDPPADCGCTCTVNGAGTVTAGCPADSTTYAGYTAPEYSATVTCNGGATLKRLVWDKVSSNRAIQRGAAPYRWCEGNGINKLTGRSPFWCNQSGGPGTTTVKAPMCSKGKYTICSTLVFDCSGTSYSAQCCKDVTAN